MTHESFCRPLGQASVREHVHVLKFGSSTLRDWQDVRRVARFLAMAVRSGKKIVAVVSARSGETDRLLAEARRLGGEPCTSLLPRHLLLGEEHSASALALALVAEGVRATHMSVADLRLVARGDALSAEPLHVEGRLDELLERFELVVVPGFGGWCGERQQPVLLGRGGSDLTAVHVAHALGAASVTLVKDVDGIYSEDPKKNGDARRFDRISWAGAREIAGRLVQPQALDAAERFRIAIHIASLESGRRSIIDGFGESSAEEAA